MQCWICQVDSCEHVRSADSTIVKVEPVEDAAQVEPQFSGNQGQGDMVPAVVPPIQTKKYFCCPDCDYRTHTKQNLNRHMRAKHKREDLFSCSECDYQSKLKGNLQRHVRAKHSDEYLFSCSQ